MSRLCLEREKGTSYVCQRCRHRARLISRGSSKRRNNLKHLWESRFGQEACQFGGGELLHCTRFLWKWFAACEAFVSLTVYVTRASHSRSNDGEWKVSLPQGLARWAVILPLSIFCVNWSYCGGFVFPMCREGVDMQGSTTTPKSLWGWKVKCEWERIWILGMMLFPPYIVWTIRTVGVRLDKLCKWPLDLIEWWSMCLWWNHFPLLIWRTIYSMRAFNGCLSWTRRLRPFKRPRTCTNLIF